MSEKLPPLYNLHCVYLCNRRGDDIKVTPKFPLMICPRDSNSIPFVFWGSSNYDPHGTYVGAGLNGYDPLMMKISVIEYDMLYQGKQVRFRHEFENDMTHLTLTGMSSRYIIMKPFKSLDDMPELPYDWQYFQFVN